MALPLASFADPVKQVLTEHAEDLLPLTRGGHCNAAHLKALTAVGPARLLPDARYPEAALSGLLLLLNCWEASHNVSQGLSTVEGSYWHGIAHRIEPDSWNAAYWFRRVGQHPIFPSLHHHAHEILRKYEFTRWKLKESWDPFLFIDWCDDARQAPASVQEQVATAIQRAEWQLLFEWCGVPENQG